MTLPDARRRSRLVILGAVAALAFVVFVGGVIAAAGDTLGYDFDAYHAAATRLLQGQPAYDLSYTAAGGFGLFYYPPPFLLLVLPFGLLDVVTATWLWIALLVAAYWGAILLMPIRLETRLIVGLVGAVSWPVGYAIKLGQVGPLLLLLFVLGWRWLDRPIGLGAAAAIGTVIKLQPALLLAWALLTRRWAAVGVGVVALLVMVVLAALVAGPGSYLDFLTLIQRTSDRITTPHNFTPGALLYQAGAGEAVASVVQLAMTVVTVVAWLIVTARARAATSYAATVVVSQLLSPVLWDHYAMLLLLPVAYLFDSGRRWAIAIPLVTATVLVTVTPGVVYPACFLIILAGLLAESARPATVASPVPA